MSFLARVDMSNSRLTTIGTVLDRTPALVSLNMAGNKLTSIPPSFSSVSRPDLTTISFSDNMLTSVPSDMLHGAASLSSVGFSDNPSLAALPEFIGPMPNLVRFEVVRSGLTVPVVMSGLSKLRYFIAYRNKFAGPIIDASPGTVATEVPILFYVDLRYNSYESIPSQFGQLPGLRYLLLQFNAIQSIPNNPQDSQRRIPLQLALSKSLRELDLGNNPLGGFAIEPLGDATIPDVSDSLSVHQPSRDAIALVHALESSGSDFAASPVQPVDSLVTDGEGTGYNWLHPGHRLFPSLLDLTISYASISGWLPQTLCRIPSLQQIIADYNAIEVIPECIPAALPRLETLHLRGNRVR